MTPQQFRSRVLRYYRAHGRHNLPWRKTRNAYRILVSEVMLQQTQVERVIPFYTNFLMKFPTPRRLAEAPLAEVLLAWQGLGYNRRAKMLHETAKNIVQNHDGRVPKRIAELEQLPGVGHYTARAVAAFAYNADAVFVETNIRTAVTYHFFSERSDISDADIFDVLTKAYPKGAGREWYAALMDYGSQLKHSGIQLNYKSKHYAKQSTFKGSAREVRGAIVRALAGGVRRKTSLAAMFSKERHVQLEQQLAALLKEGLIVKVPGGFSLP